MNLDRVGAFLKGLGQVIEPILEKLEQNTLQPLIKAAIAKEQDAELKAFFLALDALLEALVLAEMKKLA